MLNTFAINGDVLDGQTLNGSFENTGSGLLCSVEQRVVILGSGLIVSVEQDVELRFAGAGLIMSVEQNIISTGAGLFISVEQNVHAGNDFLARNGFDCSIFIDGFEIPKTQITDSVIIRKSEGKSTDLQFTILPELGVQDPEGYQGKAIIVNLTDETGTYRAFTGFVDTPFIDLIEQKITFDCTDRRDTRILGLLPSYISLIGRYSTDVFGTPKDQTDELDKRLTTVPVSFDFDNYGNPQTTEWAPKATADFVLDDDKIYYEKPNVVYTNRTKTLNTINFTVNYHFQRLHQQLANISWPGYNNFLTDWFNAGTPSFPQKDTVQSAAFAGDWKPLRPIAFTDLWPAGGYGTVVWQPNQVVNEYRERTSTIFLPYNPSPGVFSATWPNGSKYPLDSPVLDPQGKKIYDVVSTTITDTSSMLCRGATWSAGIKFAQNVIQNFQITMRSPQAITRFGIIEDVTSVDVNDSYDTSLWEKDTKNYYSTENFFIDKQTRYQDLQTAMDVSIRKARTALLGAHRQVSVNFRRGIWAQVDLKHTVQTTATKVSCKGKVSSITHTINCQTGEGYTDVSILLSRSFGGDTASLISIPAPVDDPAYIGTPTTINLGTHVGIDPNPAVTLGADKWNGYIGNKTIHSNLFADARTKFTEAFIVDYPAIPEILRGDRKVTSTAIFDIVIPNDDLEVEF